MKRTRRISTVGLGFSLGVLAVVLIGAAPQGTRPDASAVAAGAASFKIYCASCHGPGGKGDGPLAEHLKESPADLTRLTERNGGTFPFEEVKKKIDGREKVAGHGSKDMPVWGDAFKTTDSEEQAQARINEITHFLWSIQVVPGE
jgi:mono/diheme cytochrome c family protein